MLSKELSLALTEGNTDAIRSLLASGADVRYVNIYKETPMHEAVRGRLSLGPEEEQLAIVQMLVELGAEIDQSIDGKESPLVIASRRGRFNIVRFLYEAGADLDPLCWTGLHLQAAAGTVEYMQSEIEKRDQLENRDHCARTPFLLSVIAGDLAKAQFLYAMGCNQNARNQYRETAFNLALEYKRSEIVRWLIKKGANPNERFGSAQTPLKIAAFHEDTESVKILLAAGAEVHCSNGTDSTDNSPIQLTYSIEVMRLLVAAGADINEINGNLLQKLTRVAKSTTIDCSIEDYHASKHRLFGKMNPEKMNSAFWQAMVRRGCTAEEARSKFDPNGEYEEAVWCHDRLGYAFVELPNGKIIEIGGEHEDGWHPDFCIYNDVIVYHGDGTFDIYGYPKEVFPPTDFHTATLAGKHIYIIGNLGYYKDFEFDKTHVYRLDINSFVIEKIDTTGETPGGINSHQSSLTADGILVTGGKIRRLIEEKEVVEENAFNFLLDLSTFAWTRIAHASK